MLTNPRSFLTSSLYPFLFLSLRFLQRSSQTCQLLQHSQKIKDIKNHILTRLYFSVLFWNASPAAHPCFSHSPSILAALTLQHLYICTAGWLSGHSATCGTSIWLKKSAPHVWAMYQVVLICVCVWCLGGVWQWRVFDWWRAKLLVVTSSPPQQP